MQNNPNTRNTLAAPAAGAATPPGNGPRRRAVVAGAAWTVPVAAAAIATPAAAASNSPTLKFTQASYSGTGCGTITGVQVKRTTDGTTADPGKTVTVTLANGYTFADGTTTYSGTTDANGLISLPNIKVPAQGGDSTFKASSDTLAATAPVTSTKKTTIRQYADKTYGDYANIPGATSLETGYDSGNAGAPFVLTTDGTLYTRDGTKVASNVKDYSAYLNGTTTGAYYIDSKGVVKQYQGTTTTTYKTITDATEIKVGYDSGSAGAPYILTSDGTLYLLDGATNDPIKVATGVKDFSPYLNGKSNGVFYVGSDGVVKQYADGTTSTDNRTITDASVIKTGYDKGEAGAPYILTTDGTLYLLDGANTPIKVATDVKDFSPYLNGKSNGVFYVGSDGVVKQYADGTTSTDNKTITDASVIKTGYDKGEAGAPYILTTDGTLYLLDGANTPIKVATDVADFSPYLNGKSNGVYYIENATKC
ncbi:hypothetical protein SAMN06295924_107107 [Rathayibacter rathayi NCPPB 2980 = VKM Ac-1601]|uniref:hypothetical protein n=1 Tax=Rathayibacter rathayi TaxID=33887 RepID=UPI000BCE2636|nr:hypothetical protein [Rathayibacter rathayi]AZZ49992.1 hypothetical protein C1O28_13015 [Rathayibacter rathayi]TWD68732.1 hypothetical protein FB469_0426 [Rathayibacter rathayi]SOE05133.1 hypothetical protein SAMN06295924_107107 [Rathayibacter rathayi NCPPB 2980 = VKM Ac-1601]